MCERVVVVLTAAEPSFVARARVERRLTSSPMIAMRDPSWATCWACCAMTSSSSSSPGPYPGRLLRSEWNPPLPFPPKKLVFSFFFFFLRERRAFAIERGLSRRRRTRASRFFRGRAEEECTAAAEAT